MIRTTTLFTPRERRALRRITIVFWSMAMLFDIARDAMVLGWGPRAIFVDKGAWWLSWILLMPAVLWLVGRAGRTSQPRAAALLGAGIAVLTVAHLAAAAVVYEPILRLMDGPETIGVYNRFVRFSTRFSLLDLMTAIALVGTLYGALSYLRLQRRAVKEAEDAKRMAEFQLATERARLDALRAQLDPHFLYNTLNSVVALLHTGKTRDAARMVTDLGSLLRQKTRSAEDHLVPLVQELAFLKQYVDLQRVRFQDRITYSTSGMDHAEDVQFPAMMLQPIVENAIRHGMDGGRESLRIAVRVERCADLLRVVVTDSGPGMTDPRETNHGVGLSNTRKRLDLLYGPEASLTVDSQAAGGTAVTISIPVAHVGATPPVVAVSEVGPPSQGLASRTI